VSRCAEFVGQDETLCCVISLRVFGTGFVNLSKFWLIENSIFWDKWNFPKSLRGDTEEERWSESMKVKEHSQFQFTIFEPFDKN